jgi:hypothetical protein
MLALLLAARALGAPAFAWPARYTLVGTWSIPYANVSNPLVVVHEPNRQYTSQLNGLERAWTTTAAEHFHRKVVTNGDHPICYGYSRGAADWDLELTHFLPDPDGYATQPGLFAYGGRQARLHTKTVAGNKTQTWKVYTDPATGYPIAYVAHAISLFDSHYDIYVLTVEKFTPFASAGVWQLPAICNSPVSDDPYPDSRFARFLPGKNATVARPGSPFGHLTPRQFVRHMRRPRLSRADAPQDFCTAWDDRTVTAALPREFSWRNDSVVGPVRDQVACGSCWAFGAAEAVEAQIALQRGAYRAVSTNQVVDCTWDYGNEGCGGGEVHWAYSSMIRQGLPIAWEEDYPYLGLSGVCWRDPSQFRVAGKIHACYHIPHRKEAVKKALYKFGPLAVAIAVSESMLLYSGGVFDDQECTGAASDLGHVVLLTGWKIINGVETWELKNSWSPYWGWDGYIYVQAENQEWNCGVTTDAVAVVVDKWAE